MAAFSATGKALLAGGYLVLEPQYNAYVTALSSRMHAVVKASEGTTISIHSPQFAGEWEYSNTAEEINGRHNPFLEATVVVLLAYFNGIPRGADITVFSDPGFHSQKDTTSRKSPNGKSFLYHTRPIQDVPKTGLGSSACLVTVVTAALMSHWGVDVLAEKDRVHAAAQIAHCLAQKKVGSGFDVAAAVYGSIVYRRFDPSVVTSVLEKRHGEEFHSAVKAAVDSPWDFVHAQCSLPPGIRLLMGDICTGSETPKLVAMVLDWKKREPEQSAALYRDLDAANESLMAAVQSLSALHKSDPERYTEGLRNVQSGVFADLGGSVRRIRSCLQKLTEFSGAPIEPSQQTELLDACEKIPGVVGGVVPGAGGYDAIALLVADWAVEGVRGSGLEVEWLDLREEMEGLVGEDEKYE